MAEAAGAAGAAHAEAEKYDEKYDGAEGVFRAKLAEQTQRYEVAPRPTPHAIPIALLLPASCGLLPPAGPVPAGCGSQ